MQISRRAFLVDLGKGVAAGLVLSACGDSGTSSTTSTTSTSTSTSTTSTSTTSPPSLNWERVNLGGVSAFLFTRAGEVTLIDTGNPRNEDEIQAVLEEMGFGWNAVGHVIVTHAHGDHMGSLEPVMTLTPEATAYAGELDIPRMVSPRPITPVGDGDTVMGLQIIETPGHTPGHISVLDPGRVLFTGDALVGVFGLVGPPSDRFSSDLDQALQSARKLGGFEFEGVGFGHGDHILEGGRAQLDVFLATL